MSDPVQPLINFQERQAKQLQELKQNLKLTWKGRANVNKYTPPSSVKEPGRDEPPELDALIAQTFNVKKQRRKQF